MNTTITPTLQSLLLAAGFEYPSTCDGESMSKTMAAEHMPYVNEHMVDGAYLLPSASATVIVSSDGVSLIIPEIDYVEGPYGISTGEGLNLLNDAFEGIPFHVILALHHKTELESSSCATKCNGAAKTSI